MENSNNIGDLIKKIVEKDNDFVKSKICVVREYVEDAQYVNVEPLDSFDFDYDNPNPLNYINDVRLTPFKGNESTYIKDLKIPAIDSYVIVSFIDDGDKFISMYSQLEKVEKITEIGSKFIMFDDSDVATTQLNNDKLLSDANYQMFSDDEGNNYILLDADNTKIDITSNGDLNFICDGKATLQSNSSDVEISGSKIKIYNDITDLKTILSDLITTLNNNVVPDCTLVAPYGAATGAVLASDLVALQTKINGLLK